MEQGLPGGGAHEFAHDADRFASRGRPGLLLRGFSGVLTELVDENRSNLITFGFYRRLPLPV